MPDQSAAKPALAKKSLGYLTNASRKIILGLGEKSIFGLLLIISLCVSGWLLYTYAWAPLHQSGLLPAGVGRDNPGLSSNLLETINTKRAERNKYVVPSFTAFGPLFQPSVTPTPPPVTP